jgi:curved DNA-binding protein CbpA
MNNYYEILGVKETATPDEIKRAYRILAAKYHPDKNPDDPESEAMFKNVAYAYQILNNPGSRLLYDKTGKDKRPKLEDEVRGIIFNAFNNAMDHLMKAIETDTDDQFDVVKHAREFVSNGFQIVTQQKMDFTKKRDRLQRKKDKVKTKLPENVFHVIIDLQLKQLGYVIEEADHQLILIGKAKEILADYHFTKMDLSKIIIPSFDHIVRYTTIFEEQINRTINNNQPLSEEEFNEAMKDKPPVNNRPKMKDSIVIDKNKRGKGKKK